MGNLKKITLLISITILIGIITVVGVISTSQVESDDEKKLLDVPIEVEEQKIKTTNQIELEIEEKYEQIESNKEEYVPSKRIWQYSGPFMIDKYQYILGEKIFLVADSIPFNEKGDIVLYRPMNSTHSMIWNKYSFDGSIKSSFNIYFEPKLTDIRKICNKSDLIGMWMIVFDNVKYEQMNFQIIDEILPGEEDDFNQTVC